MLELESVSLTPEPAASEPLLLTEITARFPTDGHFAAILGPSGCGKSTLLKVIAGLREQSSGRISWEGRDLVEEDDLAPHEIGYVPQFSISYELLSVWESVESALRLRVGGLSSEARQERIGKILHETGLAEISDRRVKVLSGGQKRRLALALEMVSSPRLLLCDEVTSGLDPKAEDEIARLLHDLSRREKRIVFSVTHSLRHLSLCDSVIVLYQGYAIYHGSPTALFHYFGVEEHDALFSRLAARKAEDWHQSWKKHRETYYADAGIGPGSPRALPPREEAAGAVEETPALPAQDETPPPAPAGESPSHEAAAVAAADHRPLDAPVTPGLLAQFAVLEARRWKLFVRDRGQLALQLALLFGFPCLVVIFALDGLPQIKSLALLPTGNFLQQMQSEFAQRSDAMRTGSLVSGLIMFQVVLLALMGSNNGAREIAGERPIFEKEKFAGVSAFAYILSKAAFLGVLVIAQSVWMALFVNWVVRIPGSMGDQMLLLILANGALTAISLGISALSRSAEHASLISIYLVGFQLPLSGAVLAMPKALHVLTRPFIASYWAWSGFIQTLKETRFYDAVLQVTQTGLSLEPLCLFALATHVAAGFLLAYFGARAARWE